MKPLLIALLYSLAFSGYAQFTPVTSGVYKWNDLQVKSGKDRETRKVLEGSSTHLAYFEIHATTQYKGASPAKEKSSVDTEECIILKHGKMRVTVEGKSSILGPGSVILLMPQQMHTLENIGDGNLTYYVMRYRSKNKMDIERGRASGGSLMLNADSLEFKPSAKGGGRPYFDRSTAMCERFEMHVTRLNNKGESHAPHRHVETEIILVISGDTEMTIDGKEFTASAGDLYLMASDSFHGIRNRNDSPCEYFAFKWK